MIQITFTEKKIEYILSIFHSLFKVTEMEKRPFICNLPFVCYIVYASVG